MSSVVEGYFFRHISNLFVMPFIVYRLKVRDFVIRLSKFYCVVFQSDKFRSSFSEPKFIKLEVKCLIDKEFPSYLTAFFWNSLSESLKFLIRCQMRQQHCGERNCVCIFIRLPKGFVWTLSKYKESHLS